MNIWAASSAALAWLWRATWEASVLAALILVIQAVLRRKLSAQWRFALWGLVVLRLALPASIPTPWSAFNLFSHRVKLLSKVLERQPSETKPAIPSARLSASAPLSVPAPVSLAEMRAPSRLPAEPRGYQVIACVWFAGMLAFGLRLILANWWLCRTLAKAARVKEPNVLTLLDECARLMCVERAPILVTAPRLDSPAGFCLHMT